jgi:hypothetical protein
MEISVRQRGGFFGIDRTVRLDRRGMHVRDGAQSTPVAMDSTTKAHVRKLAKRVLATPPDLHASNEALVPDDLMTEVVIKDAKRHLSVSYTAADEPSVELWELVGTLADAAETASASSSPEKLVNQG